MTRKTVIVALLLAFALSLADARAARQTQRQATPPPNPALVQAPSPYLRHHAHDAVRWRVWGEAAFAEARRRNVPVFLSVGYLACYWCSVMQRENFADPEVAALLNRHFVPVLVDREARPAVDTLYMTVAQALNGVAGWPNNVFLTPDRAPFHAVGYLPKPQFLALLREVRARWEAEPETLRRNAHKIAEIIRAHMERRAEARMALSRLKTRRFVRLAREVAARFDPFFGGLNATPKHFRAPLLLFLARAALAHEDATSREALLKTLRSVTHGAVYDHLEHGFFRYATDAAWHIPHFEKMLYDQALMVDALREGWRLSGDEALKRAALETLKFTLSRLRTRAGAFAATLSATAPDGEEGGHYLFTPEELRRLLPKEDAAWALKTFGQITDGELAGKVVVQVQDVDFSDAEEVARLRRVLSALRAAAARRPPHTRDDKVISGWNGLMIGALARAALAWREEQFAKEAALAARFVLERLRTPEGLARHWLNGAAHGRATLADYAYLVDGLLALYDAQVETRWLRAAAALAEEARKRFHDERAGRWWLSAESAGFARLRSRGDGPLPAADAQMALNLLRLADRTGERKWRTLAEETLSALLPRALKAPVAHATTLRAVDIALRGDDTAVRYAAGGNVRARAWWRDAMSGAFAVRLTIARGWHVQAHRPDDENLVPTDVRPLRPAGVRLKRMRWPAPVVRRLGFAKVPLKLLEGTVRIEGVLAAPRTAHGPVALELQLQACSDDICLPPENPPLYLPARTPLTPRP